MLPQGEHIRTGDNKVNDIKIMVQMSSYASRSYRFSQKCCPRDDKFTEPFRKSEVPFQMMEQMSSSDM